MKYIFILLVFCWSGAQAQFPRNDLDQFELAQEITVSAPDSILAKRAKLFFRQPFIVHWDSVAFVDPTHTGKGHVDIRINHWLSGFQIPVMLKLELTIKHNGYRYSIRHLEANKKDSKYQFPLEQKPQDVNSVIYEQLQQKTYDYLSSTVSILKRYMAGDMPKQ